MLLPITLIPYRRSSPYATNFDTHHTNMDTLDEQLDAANAQVAELTAQLTALQQENATLQAANEELTENLTHTREQLAGMEGAHRQALEDVQRLKAEAKTAEERAAEYYGAAAAPQHVTTKGDPDAVSLHERFAAIKTPGEQTVFLRSLTDAQRAELYSNI